MYGKAVHEAIIAANEHQSGITIHYVDELYDHGESFSASINFPEETAETLAEKFTVWNTGIIHSKKPTGWKSLKRRLMLTVDD
jgi:folate-dependent phosphoribosylglycinamide formyltransferase PurN